ncbi:MAG: hypothetical protein FJ313_05445 [Gemmatimonadetes bacterium]|nr:hypothetical protein [Gemmatimonadota bacterium]
MRTDSHAGRTGPLAFGRPGEVALASSFTIPAAVVVGFLFLLISAQKGVEAGVASLS